TGATRRPSHDVPRHDETEPVSHRERGWGEGSAERQAEHIATDVQQARTNAADNGDLGRIHRPAEPSSGASRRLLPEGEGKDSFPLHAITQRPMFMYHAWGSQNAWLRQITARNFLYLHP